MYCVKNRIYCHDCNSSYIDSNYSNHLRSRGHIDNVIKKQCDNNNLTCCMDKLSLTEQTKTEIIYLNNKMPCTQNRIYCGVCHISVLPDNYQNHIRSQGHASNVLKNPYTNSMIIKTLNKKR